MANAPTNTWTRRSATGSALAAVTVESCLDIGLRRSRRLARSTRSAILWRISVVHIELRPVDSIRPYEHNPRVNDAAVDIVAASIREFGFRQPIVVDVEGVIIVGHTRWK